nr:maltose O-acetyltransferase similar protein [Alternaria alternata]
MTTPEETSSSNKRDPAIADGSGHTDEHLSATEPAALGSRHSLLAQPSPRIEEVGGVGHMQLSSHPDVIAELQDTGCTEHETPENSCQKGLEPWELASRESQRAHACTLEEKDSPLSALLTTWKALETREQHEMPGKLEILRAMPSAPTDEAVHREPKLQAASKAMSSAKRSSEPTLEQATPFPLKGGPVEELHLASVSSERSPGRLSKDGWIHEKAAIQHAIAEPDVSDEPSGFLARSERSMSLSAKQSEFIVQHRRTRACTVPMAATDRAPIAPSALSTQLGLRLDTKTTAGQAFVKQDVNPLKADIRDLRDPTTSNWSVREPEIVPESEEQVRVANSMDTTDREQADPITRVSLSPKSPSGGEVDQNCASRRYKDGCRTVSRFASPIVDSVDMSPTSSSGTPRSTLERADRFSDELAMVPYPVRKPFVTASCSGSPIHQKSLHDMELASQHTQPRGDDCRYSHRQSASFHELSQRNTESLQHRDACPVKSAYSNATLAAEPHLPVCRADQSSVDRAVAIKPMDGAAHIEPRRNKPFMKRVKTGCGICRRRKKKCDEAKPECNNCTRIGITCQGYMGKTILQKNVVPTSLTSLSDQTPKPTGTHQPRSRPHGHDLAYILNNEPSLGSNHSIHQEPHAPVQSADTDGGVTVEERESQLPASSRGTDKHDLLHPSLSWCEQAAGPPKTEKEKMLDGEPFMSCDTQLVDDRRQCAAMLYHFNNTINTIPKVVQPMRERYLRAALDAACTQPRSRDGPVSGRLGSGAHIVTPFHCDYGYNVSIGDNVIIGPNSRLLDSAQISIGRNTRIGACVIVTTLEAPTNMKVLKTGCSLEVAKDTYIGENVYVGDCCVVGAGVRVGNGATIRSGSLVVCDIPPNSIVCGNPADAYEAG